MATENTNTKHTSNGVLSYSSPSGQTFIRHDIPRYILMIYVSNACPIHYIQSVLHDFLFLTYLLEGRFN